MAPVAGARSTWRLAGSRNTGSSAASIGLLGAGIVALLDDPERAAVLGRDARERFRSFEWSAQEGALIEAYSRVFR